MSGPLNPSHNGQPEGLYLLFDRVSRPTSHAVKSKFENHASVSVSFDPGRATGLKVVAGRDIADPDPPLRDMATDKVWLELLSGGLTFDLEGLAPGESAPFPRADHAYDLREGPLVGNHSALLLRPGTHLSGGSRTMPVLSGLLSVACQLVTSFPDLKALIWAPARCAMGAQYFESIASAWLDGGPFPGLGLVSYESEIDGALQSIGLSHWLGKELRIEPELATDKRLATRLATRLVNHLILSGDLEQPQSFTAPDGQRLSLGLSANRKFVRVSRE